MISELLATIPINEMLAQKALNKEMSASLTATNAEKGLLLFFTFLMFRQRIWIKLRHMILYI